MNRLSYWMDTANAPNYPELSESIKCDIAVIGAGLTGITAALLLKKTGADVVVLEASRVGSGTSGYTTGKVTAQHGLKLQTLSGKKREAYYRANDAGFKRIEGFIRDHSIDCDFERAPSFVYTRDENDMHLLEKEMREYERLGINGRLVSDTDLPFEVRGALVMEDQAQFHPLKYLHSLAAGFVNLGGRVFEHSKVLEFNRQESCVLRTDKGSLSAKSAIFATNYPFVDFPGLFFLKLHQERAFAICTDAKETEITGAYINIHEPANSVRIHRSGDSKKLLLVGYGHRTAKEDDDRTGYESLEDILRADFKNADPRPSYEWSAQDCFTGDGMPYVGALFSKYPNVYVATGYEKWGITNSAAAAMMVTDYAAGTNYIDHEVREKFDPIRFTPGASAKNFFVQAGTVLKAFTMDNALLPAGEYEDIEPGKGAVMRVNGKARAVFRDEGGEIHAFGAHCTHLGCTLEYNEAEKSFDCPCHGSRFSTLGEVLDSPAKTPLKKISEEDE